MRVVNETPMTRGFFPRYGRERAETSQQLMLRWRAQSEFLLVPLEVGHVVDAPVPHEELRTCLLPRSRPYRLKKSSGYKRFVHNSHVALAVGAKKIVFWKVTFLSGVSSLSRPILRSMEEFFLDPSVLEIQLDEIADWWCKKNKCECRC